MTANDTTYFLSEPAHFKNNDGTRHYNTFQFLRLNTNYRPRTYSDQEIKNRLERPIKNIKK